jgi:catechol 2,3-dioxygenase-like lactoylglutathione lyase family enzyme
MVGRALHLYTILLQTSDMNRSVSWFRDALGLSPGYSSPYWSEYDLGGQRLGLHPSISGAEPMSGAGPVLCVATDDILQLRARLHSLGVSVDDALHDTPSGAVLDFTDPDGNRWQAIQVGKRTDDF